MDTARGTTREVDLHRLDLRFADARLLEPRAVERLARSIEQSGQLIPCIAVSDEGSSDRLVLVDGYRRILALRRLGRDTACVECWACDLTQALLTVLARAHGRPFAALEEALLLRELVHHQWLSQHEAARRSGRDVSWSAGACSSSALCPRSCWRRCARAIFPLGLRPACWPRWRAPTPGTPRNCSAHWRAHPCLPGNCSAGSSTTRAPRVRPGRTWSSTHGCSSRRCKCAMSSAPTSACARAPKGSARPMSGNCSHSSSGCASACRRSVRRLCRSP